MTAYSEGGQSGDVDSNDFDDDPYMKLELFTIDRTVPGSPDQDNRFRPPRDGPWILQFNKI